jgi:hypothetical protein
MRLAPKLTPGSMHKTKNAIFGCTLGAYMANFPAKYPHFFRGLWPSPYSHLLFALAHDMTQVSSKGKTPAHYRG